MLLVIDIGNTDTVIGVYEDENLIHHWRLRTEKDATVDELHLLIRNLFSLEGATLESITGTIISCVVPPMINILNSFCARYLHHQPLWVDASTFKDMPILYDNPKEVGADRIVNAVSAFHKYRTSLIVVDFGTATTFDCISQEGAYLGGAISPGILISSEALFQKASKLPRTEIFARPKRVIARDTISSMNAGIIYGYAGLVDGIVRRIKQEMTSDPKVIATGGLAKLMAEAAETIEAVEPHLTLEGLRIIYSKIRKT
ncbi:MAG: type III pantothenate kinase [Deltaproteobacteria bacterium]|nr:type III pantothenate kinase [Deltaproteobacteria bacterium]MBW2019278.1 type III pantothenate kinase [Deltaproteobacteria bacterium]MBW2074101.1 type III pantothenate kinase [Deltaproteobacteria bacterium]RLB82570.1 MAG: type III pantothenate kinase [Deltaproteobacteria bacterium]